MGKVSAVSPLAPDHFPQLPVIEGVRFATIAAGVRYQGRTDVMLAVLAPGSTVAGAFTKSATRAAPVLDCQAKIGGVSEDGAAILVNSGNANAFTGKNGVAAVEAITAAVAEVCGISQSRVFTSSTGVIGEPLPHERVTAVLPQLQSKLDPEGISDAAKAIMTTDTFPKGAREEIEIDGKAVSIAGIAKGSGMIAPDMATMLVYIFTDAIVSQSALQKMLSRHTETTFNCITVDSDTSTSDSLILAATGASGVDASESDAFSDALYRVMLNLAHQVVQDGEGATKFVEIAVTGAATDEDAKIHGMAIANSPLIKTAIAGQDPNWGRVVMAIGKSGAAADRDRLSIRFGDIEVAKEGWRSPNYSEEAAAAHMKGQNIVIGVDLGIGEGKATVWTCDLTHGYIDINADYRS
ncbi:MAG: bifunctional glutamate N-acetyltransferase/amino-acid acetyltransferase ArgJ [Sulfitobacter sp.]|jgi:glutamate N-acetyltransferase/amino-acid N-acetyltransferase|tara:strand:+ start:920 stop:2146 length:1227 start_codon:yes stop_codon:yes gene_type:complete